VPSEVPELATVLRLLREGQGWSAPALARAVGLPPTAVLRFEQGKRELRRPQLEQLAGAMGLPASVIEPTLSYLHSIRLLGRAPLPLGTKDRIEEIAVEIGGAVEALVRSHLRHDSLAGRGGEGA